MRVMSDGYAQILLSKDGHPVYAKQRQAMVEEQLEGRDITDARVIAAMLAVPRHLFVPQSQLDWAYADRALPIEYGQTISQPYIVGFMTQSLAIQGTEKVLEIGTGSGYQAAVLAELGITVYTIEVIAPLAHSAKKLLQWLGYANIHGRHGDGYAGWPEVAPFDAIIVTCAPDHVPEPLRQQLKIGGRMMIPVGDVVRGQELIALEKVAASEIKQRNIWAVRFVPMTGEAEQNKGG